MITPPSAYLPACVADGLSLYPLQAFKPASLLQMCLSSGVIITTQAPSIHRGDTGLTSPQTLELNLTFTPCRLLRCLSAQAILQ